MRTPSASINYQEIIVPAVERAGLTGHNIVAYCYYGSHAVNLATDASDEDILVVIDTQGIRSSTKSYAHGNIDVRLIPVQEMIHGFEGLLDVWAIGDFVYPEHVRTINGVAMCARSPWAAMLKNLRPSVYDAIADMYSVTRRAEVMCVRGVRQGKPPERLYKLVKRVLKQRMVEGKIQEYAAGFYGHARPYKPVFTDAEKCLLFCRTEEALRRIQAGDPPEVVLNITQNIQ
jgi:hypothetical protein